MEEIKSYSQEVESLNKKYLDKIRELVKKFGGEYNSEQERDFHIIVTDFEEYNPKDVVVDSVVLDSKSDVLIFKSSENDDEWREYEVICGWDFDWLIESMESEFGECEYVCPECGHVFKQGEWDYNYDTALLDFMCPECEWEGNERQLR